jgi:hypothetical protein
MTRELVLGIAGTLALAALVFSCSSSNSSSDPSGATGVDRTPGGEQSPAPSTIEDPRIERALALRSVQMQLTTTLPGKEPARVLATVDAEGNQLIETRLPLGEGSTVLSEAPDANVLEIFVVDGKAYSRVGKEGPAESSPEQAGALHSLLYNATGPGLWLELLPEGSLQAAGTETTGGFTAVKYTVSGSVEEGTIRGTIWLEQGTETLIGADLAISESLFYPPNSGRAGTVAIRLTVEKADVPAVVVPTS